MSLRLETFPDDAWAAEIVARLKDRIAPDRRLCLATGTTVVPLYASIDDLPGVEIFLLDEFGGLPVDDPGRCRMMIQRDLTDHLIGDPVVHVPDVDASDPEKAATEYGAMLADGGIDLAVVGLGVNGHIGMNEPGSGPGDRTRVVTLAESTSATAALSYGASVAPNWGITVGMAELMSAREVWVVVTGDQKSNILERVLTVPVTSDIPATFLRDHPNCTVLADSSAASDR